MKRGFFSRFARNAGAPVDTAAPEMRRAEPGIAPENPAETIAEIIREIAGQELPGVPRKAAISLRLDADVLDWFRAQGPGYQTRINAILKAYKDAAG
jgi:uncharacterized protein (DUF4415 family)